MVNPPPMPEYMRGSYTNYGDGYFVKMIKPALKSKQVLYPAELLYDGELLLPYAVRLDSKFL